MFRVAGCVQWLLLCYCTGTSFSNNMSDPSSLPSNVTIGDPGNTTVIIMDSDSKWL